MGAASKSFGESNSPGVLSSLVHIASDREYQYYLQ